jgi:hypothetical protein
MTQPVESENPPRRALPRPNESLAELAAKQQIRPVTDLSAIGKLWPADDDPDAFDEFMRDQREARRSAARRK